MLWRPSAAQILPLQFAAARMLPSDRCLAAQILPLQFAAARMLPSDRCLAARILQLQFAAAQLLPSDSCLAARILQLQILQSEETNASAIPQSEEANANASAMLRCHSAAQILQSEEANANTSAMYRHPLAPRIRQQQFAAAQILQSEETSTGAMLRLRMAAQIIVRICSIRSMALNRHSLTLTNHIYDNVTTDNDCLAVTCDAWCGTRRSASRTFAGRAVAGDGLPLFTD